MRAERSALLSRPAPQFNHAPQFNRAPHAPIIEPQPATAPVPATVPEAILVEIDTDNTPTLPPNAAPSRFAPSTQPDLIVFELPPGQASQVVDLLTNTSHEDTTPPAFGAV